MKILLAQIIISENYKKNVLKMINLIKKNKFYILVFLELSLISYYLDKAIQLDKKLILKLITKIQNILTKNQIVIVGTIAYKKYKIYNSSAIILSDNVNHYYKNTLTDYDK